jgi:hypothetical protein
VPSLSHDVCPTQKLEYVVADVQLAVGCFQLADTLVCGR